MAPKRLEVCRVRGVSIEIDRSVFLLLPLLIVFFATYLPNAARHQITSAVAASLLFILSLLLHELGHAWFAVRYGLPVRSINLFIYGGFTDMGRRPAAAMQEFKITIAGPAVSAALALLCDGISDAVAGSWPAGATVAYVLARLNMMLTLLNLLPIFPLDGGRALRAALWALSGDYGVGTQRARFCGRIQAFGMMLIGVWLLLQAAWVAGLAAIIVGWRLKDVTAAGMDEDLEYA